MVGLHATETSSDNDDDDDDDDQCITDTETLTVTHCVCHRSTHRTHESSQTSRNVAVIHNLHYQITTVDSCVLCRPNQTQP